MIYHQYAGDHDKMIKTSTGNTRATASVPHLCSAWMKRIAKKNFLLNFFMINRSTSSYLNFFILSSGGSFVVFDFVNSVLYLFAF